MFEYHCWAVAEPDARLDDGRTLLQQLRDRIAALPEGSRESFHVTTLNEVHVIATGLRNHYRPEVLDVFQWLAKQCPRCYGLMYLRGDPGEDGAYRFQVQRIGNGEIEFFEDPFFVDVS
jgi:hypothetical protein